MSKVSSPKDITVLIADDHPIMRQGLRIVLEANEGFDVIGEAEDGEQAVLLAQKLKPDIIIMDLKMPVKDGIVATQEIGNLLPDTRILVLTSDPKDDKVFEAIKAGAVGYFLKETPPEQLIDALRMVSNGSTVLQQEIAAKVIAEIRKPPAPTDTKDALTQRETEILRFLARGYSNQEIADELVISIRTVATHVGNILSKLHLASRTQAALYALDQGLNEPPDS